MLSAIAARKAAQAAKLTAPPVVENTNVNSVDATPAPSDSERSKPHSTKRKPSTSARNGVFEKKKRKKDVVRIENTRQRYFQQQEDVTADDSDDDIIIDSREDRNDASSSGSDDSDVRDGEEQPEIQLTSQTTSSSRRTRAWSPSQAVVDSDSEGSEIDEGPSTVLESSTPMHVHRRREHPPSVAQSAFDTSFVAKPGSNVIKVNAKTIASVTGRTQANGTQNGTIVVLEPGETVALLGTYGLTVLQGAIEVLGTTLHPSSRQHHVFAPKCSPIPVLTATKTPESSCRSNLAELEAVLSHINSTNVVFLVQLLHTGVEGLGRVCRTFSGVFDVDHGGLDVLGIGSARMVSKIQTPLIPFSLPPSWGEALSSQAIPDLLQTDQDNFAATSQPIIALVKGAKRTGKSTFARTLLNRLATTYKRVAYLECDVGQTEFTPPGLVALHVIDRPVFGPPFTHSYIPYQAHYIGSSTPRDSPKHYLSAVEALLQTYKLDLQYAQQALDSSSDDDRIDDAIPLVVNTMGWTKGLGADLLRRIEELVQPTMVFEMGAAVNHSSSVAKREKMPGPSRSNAPVTFNIEAIRSEQLSTRFTAADWRTISLMSYFHSTPSFWQFSLLPLDVMPVVLDSPIVQDDAPLCSWNTTLPLLAVPPYAVDPREALDEVVLVGAGTEDVVPSEIGRVLNGALVALVRSTDVSTRNDITIPYKQGAPPPDPLTSTCVGLALIRSVSPDANISTLHVLTPVPPVLLSSSSCRTLVKGPLEIPIWGMLDYRDFDGRRGRTTDYDKEGIPYLQWGKADGVGGDRRRVRRNLMRKSQMGV